MNLRAVQRDDEARWLGFRIAWAEVAAAYARRCLADLEREFALTREGWVGRTRDAEEAQAIGQLVDLWATRLGLARHAERISQRELVALKGQA